MEGGWEEGAVSGGAQWKKEGVGRLRHASWTCYTRPLTPSRLHAHSSHPKPLTHLALTCPCLSHLSAAESDPPVLTHLRSSFGFGFPFSPATCPPSHLRSFFNFYHLVFCLPPIDCCIVLIIDWYAGGKYTVPSSPPSSCFISFLLILVLNVFQSLRHPFDYADTRLWLSPYTFAFPPHYFPILTNFLFNIPLEQILSCCIVTWTVLSMFLVT